MMLCVHLQYMVLYQLLLAMLFNTTFFMDGSTVSYRQVRNDIEISSQMGNSKIIGDRPTTLQHPQVSWHV